MKSLTFNQIHKNRKNLLNQNKTQDHVVIEGENNILISAPHGVSQVRLGKFKFSEIGSMAIALYLKNTTKCHMIAKTQNNNDDANFDEHSPYKSKIVELIKKHNIKYLLDFHGLAQKHGCDINLCTHLGKNIETNLKIFDELCKQLKQNGFAVNIDQPFMANSNTIASSMKKQFPDLWTLQIEINCAITNQKQNFERYKTLLSILENWINNLT